MEFTMEKVSAVPRSHWKLNKRGESKYNEIFISLKDLPINEPQKIKHPSLKAAQIYNALHIMLKKKRMNNIRLAIRKGTLYAEKMFE